MREAIKIILVEDSPVDAELTLRELDSAALAYTAMRVEKREDFISALSSFSPDIILSDFTMPAFDGLSALTLLREANQDIPFIFVSGTIREDRAIASLKRGATDYILKTNLGRLAPAIERAVLESRERIGRREDQTKLVESLKKLHLVSNYDVVTALPVRLTFCTNINELLQAADRQTQLAVGVIDIEHFRLINESLGWDAGNTLLDLFAKRLMESLSSHHAVCRISSDVFGFYVEAQEIEKLEERIYNRLLPMHQPFHVMNRELRVAFKYGIALSSGSTSTAEELLQNAEIALRKAKEGISRHLVYSPAMHSRAHELLELENKLRIAIAEEQFVLHYQPKFDITASQLTGLEALIRWDSPELGRVAPSEFIPVLEETGLISEVGAWVFQRAIKDWTTWKDSGVEPPRIAINVSPQQLNDKAFLQQISIIMQERLPFDVEITENILIENIAGQVAALDSMRKAGIGIEIDDFGIGHSSLSYIATLPVTGVKIDRSFVARMISERASLKVVSAIIALAHSLDFKVTAEGVETKEQWELLKKLNCDAVQGYLFSRPVPEKEIAVMLNSRQVK